MSPTATLAQDLIGQWLLKSRIDLDASGQRHIDPFLGPDPAGFLVFGPQWFAAQFMKADRTSATVPATPTAPAGAGNNTSAVGGYDAYFGTYTVDTEASDIRTTLLGALTPGNVGQTFTRRVAIAGTTLKIILATSSASGVPITRTLTFERVQ